MSVEKRHDCILILVCCSSNIAVDAIGEKLLKGFNLKGKHYFPEIVRIARNRYDFRDSWLAPHSHLEKGRAFEAAIYAVPGQETKKYPNNKAIAAMAKQCVVVLCTNSTSSSTTLKNMKVYWMSSYMMTLDIRLSLKD